MRILHDKEITLISSPPIYLLTVFVWIYRPVVILHSTPLLLLPAGHVNSSFKQKEPNLSLINYAKWGSMAKTGNNVKRHLIYELGLSDHNHSCGQIETKSI